MRKNRLDEIHTGRRDVIPTRIMSPRAPRIAPLRQFRYASIEDSRDTAARLGQSLRQFIPLTPR
jgi:hypothetical protein